MKTRSAGRQFAEFSGMWGPVRYHGVPAWGLGSLEREDQ